MLTHNFTGDTKADVKSLLYAKGKEKTYIHVKSVAEMNRKIAAQYGLDENICELCGYLHDISALIPPKEMLSYAVNHTWYIDECERKYPFLLHQRISVVISREDFGVTDERILSAIGHHTTLKANPSAYDMAVFVADKLAWDQEGNPPFFTAVCEGLNHSLEAASLAYMNYMVEKLYQSQCLTGGYTISLIQKKCLRPPKTAGIFTYSLLISVMGSSVILAMISAENPSFFIFRAIFNALRYSIVNSLEILSVSNIRLLL